MTPEIERAYLREIQIQAQYVRRAKQRATEVYDKDSDSVEFFREMTALLLHAGSLSRILWPPMTGKKEVRLRTKSRGAHLRRVLGVGDDSPLNDRTLRNHFEHFDERLDEWAELIGSGHPMDLYFFCGGDHQGGQQALRDALRKEQLLRGFDPTTETIFFHGDPFDVHALLKAVDDVRNAAGKRSNEAERELVEAARKPQQDETP